MESMDAQLIGFIRKGFKHNALIFEKMLLVGGFTVNVWFPGKKYGCSIIRHKGSYGYRIIRHKGSCGYPNEYEIALIRGDNNDWDIVESNEVFRVDDDVIGYLDVEGVISRLVKIRELED